MSVNAKQARKEFTDKYSPRTRDILRWVSKNPQVSSERVADMVGCKRETVTTTRGNLTRGFYAPYFELSKGKVVGSCNY